MPLGRRLTPALTRFVEAQPLFFVATATAAGRVNLSPKGADTLRVLGPERIQWLNLSGSGNETAGHLRAFNRITLMFCAFSGDPLILRVYGRGEVIHPRDAAWSAAIGRFPRLAGSRQVFNVSVEAVQTSCGTGVPEMEVLRERVTDDLAPFYAEMGEDGLRDYWRRKNTHTIDGLPTAILGD